MTAIGGRTLESPGLRNCSALHPRRVLGDEAPAIVLGGYIAGIGVIRALGAMGIPTVAVWSAEGEVARSLSAHAAIRIEAPDPEGAEADYIDLLLRLSERTGGGLLVPTSDATLEVVARHKETPRAPLRRGLRRVGDRATVPRQRPDPRVGQVLGHRDP